MRREEAVALLKELKTTFPSVESTNSVLLKNEERVAFWELIIKWNPQPEEKAKLQSLTAKHNLEVFFGKGQTSFRRSK